MTRPSTASGAQERVRAAILVALAAGCAGALTIPVSGDAAETVTRQVATGTVDVPAPSRPRGLSLKAGIVVDARTGGVLWSRNEHEVRLIASTTKIMTALVALSRAQPDDVLTATAYAANPAESVLGLSAGERITVRDLLRALLLASANDAADTLAARLASSRAAFVDAMNRRARALRLTDTRFGNSIGLDHPRTVSSARDLATLTREALKNALIRATVNKTRVELRSGSKSRSVTNRNRLVGRFKFVDGVKTGHTNAAGYLLVGAAHRYDASVISVVMGAPSEAARDADSLALLRYGRLLFRRVAPVRAGAELARIPVALQDETAAVTTRRDAAFTARDGGRYSVVMSAPDELEGPLSAGTKVGTVRVTRDGKKIAELPVFLKSAIAAPPVQSVMLNELERMLPLLALLGIAFMMGLLVQRRRVRSRNARSAREVQNLGEQFRVDLTDVIAGEIGTTAKPPTTR